MTKHYRARTTANVVLYNNLVLKIYECGFNKRIRFTGLLLWVAHFWPKTNRKDINRFAKTWKRNLLRPKDSPVDGAWVQRRRCG